MKLGILGTGMIVREFLPWLTGADSPFTVQCICSTQRSAEAAGELWSQYEARLGTDASQERVRSIEDTDSALLWRLQLIESAEREVIFSTFDLRADGSGQDLMAALYGAAQRGVQVRVIVDGLNGFLHLQNSHECTPQ